MLLLLAALLVGAPAAEGQVAAAGPALAPGAVLWGEERADGSLAVVRRPFGGPAEVLRDIPAPTAENGLRSFYGVPGALSASAAWTVYSMDDTVLEVDGDLVTSELHGRAYASRRGGAFADALPHCGDAGYIATAADGDAIALGVAGADCGGRYATRVWLIEGDAPPRAIFTSRADYVGLRQVRLAGRFIAWSQGGSGAGDRKVVVAERASGDVVARLPARAFGGSVYDSFDLDARGRVAALTIGRKRCRRGCIGWRKATGGPLHRIARATGGIRVEIAARRIAFFSRRGYFARRIVIARLDGTVDRRLGRFTRRRQPAGDLALTRDRVAWSVADPEENVRGGPGAVHTAPLR